MNHLRSPRPVEGLALWLLCTVAPLPSAGQERLTSGDVVRLPSPPPDHRIAYGGDSLQFGNLRLPKTSGPHPVVVFLHGGCWLPQFGIGHAGPLEQALADSGYAVWSIEYRRAGNPGGGWPGTFLDVARGADHLRALAAEHDLDLDRVIASGHSAGGHFALWLAARHLLPEESELYVPDPLSVRGVFALAPAPDLEGLHAAGVCGNIIDQLMGGSPSTHPTRYAHGSPMQLTPVQTRQVLVVGAYDRSWGPIGRAYYERARTAGAQHITLVDAPDSGHFEMIVPSTSTWPLVIRTLRELLEEVAP